MFRPDPSTPAFLPGERDGNDRYPEQQVGGSDGGQQEEPEPQKKVYLFIDDVQREHAKTVVFLLPSGGAYAVKRAAAKAQLIVVYKHNIHVLHARYSK